MERHERTPQHTNRALPRPLSDVSDVRKGRLARSPSGSLGAGSKQTRLLAWRGQNQRCKRPRAESRREPAKSAQCCPHSGQSFGRAADSNRQEHRPPAEVTGARGDTGEEWWSAEPSEPRHASAACLSSWWWGARAPSRAPNSPTLAEKKRSPRADTYPRPCAATSARWIVCKKGAL